jgi:hypothetical protein
MQALLCGCFAGLLLAACSEAAPEIVFGSLSLVQYEDGERYSFFIRPEDSDGIEDLSSLSLYYDASGLFWHMSADNWISYESNGNTWIGSRSIAMPDGGTLPRGQFRAVLVDKSGDRGERFFAFDSPVALHPFPSFTLQPRAGTYRIESEYPVNRLLCYDASGNYNRSVTPPALEGAISDLGLPSSIAAVALWAEDPDYATSALSAVTPLN